MKKFIKLILIFIAPVLILVMCTELLLRNIPNDYSYKKKYLDKNSDHVEALFLGNSHIYYGINPEYSKLKSFNAAHISQSLKYDVAIYEKYKSNFKKLKFIIVSMDYLTLNFCLETSLENWRVKNYAIYYDIAAPSLFDNFEMLNGRTFNNVLRLKYYMSGPSAVTCNKWGFGDNYNSIQAKDLIATGKEAAKRHKDLIKDKVGFNENIQFFLYLVNESKKNNFNLLFLTPPAFSSYIENVDKKILNTTTDLIKITTSQNNNIRFYNLLSDTSFTSKDFFDGDHLNEIGAKKLTLKVNDFIESDF